MPDARSLLSPTEEADTHSTFYKIPGLMTAVAPEDQPFCGQKRKQSAIDEEHSTTAATISQPPWKKAKRPHQSQQETNTAYWDSLSKLWLTRGALNELNRRNRQTAGLVRTSVTRRPDLSGEPTALKNRSYQLKRFARHGGPDLCDLRGVGKVQVKSRQLLTPSF
jgi:hypothetical protein